MHTFSSLRGPKPLAYEVILSCGDDTRLGFTGFLSHSLNNRGFRTCIDHHPEAAKMCRIFIVVLSDGYASSRACLDELANIMDEFAMGNGRMILPVYYRMNPSDVRHQTGSFGKALAVHKNQVAIPETERFDKWTKALCKVADFSGWHLDWTRDKYEHQYIEEILQKVSQHMACSVGLNRQVEKVMSCLYSGSDDRVCMVVGICGVPGIGKTTIARAVYHSNAGNGFDYYCFFDKAGEYLSKHGSEWMLLSEIVGDISATFENVDEGMSIMKQMLNQKKVFLILEHINDPEHLKVIAELTTCFGYGSKVIITAREKYLLEFHGIERIYEVERLNNKEAFQLLSLKVFNSKNFEPSYFSILERAATYASGHPFVLELIGSHLGGKSMQECESALGQYEIIPNHEIQKILQVSFDALGKYRQRMLIHIAIHLTEWELALVEDKLYHIYGVCPKKDIRVLFDKSLIKINELGRVTLHGLTLDMVRDNASLEYPCKKSRLSKDVLEENMEYPCKHSRLSKDILEENTEYPKQQILPASDDQSMILDPMELEYQVSYQHCHCSSSSSQRPTPHNSEE